MRIKNYKLSLIVDKKMAPSISSMGRLKITVYKSSPYLINITGVRRLSDLCIVKKKMRQKSIKIMRTRIDAIMISKKGRGNFNITNLIASVLERGGKYHYEPEIWPAIEVNVGDLPTILIFRTGSAQCFGLKSFKQVQAVNELVRRIFDGC